MVGWSLDKNATTGDFTITLDEVDSATVYAVWQPCASGTYKTDSPGGEDACSACPDGYRDGAGAASQSNCEAQCAGGQYVPSVHAACAPVGVGYWRGAHSVKYGATDTRTQCATGLTTIGSGAGADEAGDCGRVLNIGSQKIYLRSDKKTDRALHVGINGDVFYGNMSTSIDGPLKINYNGTTYSVYDDSME